MKYFTLLTAIGEQKLTNALAQNTHVTITHMAVGDGGGTLPIPSHHQTQLVNETYRAPLNRLIITPDKANQLLAEMIIPAEIGGMWTRELGLIDSDGDLFAIGNHPESYKPLRTEGAAGDQIMRMVITSSHSECITILSDPSVVVATTASVNNAIEQLRSVYVPLTRTINNKSLLADITLNAADLGLSETVRKAGIAYSAENPPPYPIVPQNTALIDINGWWKCGDTGLIIQWGIVRPPPIGHSTVNVPLPTNFPNKGLWAFGYVAAAMPYDNDAISGSAGLLGTAPNTTIRVTTDNGAPTAWLAIGY